MDTKELFTRSVDLSMRCVQHVTPDSLHNQTPCSEWDLEHLLNHITYELLWVPDLLAGKTVAEVGAVYDGDVLGDNAQQALKAAAEKANKAVQSVQDMQRTVHLSYGDVPAQHYIDEMISEVIIHTWDVDQSIKCNLIIPEDIAQYVYSKILPRKQEFESSGLFAPLIEVSDDSPIHIKLLGLVGRKLTEA